MPIMSPLAGRRQSHLPRAAVFALAAMASTALTPPVMAAEFPPVIELSSLNGTTGFRLDGINAGDLSGGSVGSAGDVNGDGFADIIIGAKGGDPNAHTDAGESYVVFGKAFGFASGINLGSLNGTSGFRLDGIEAFGSSGRAVAAAGDVNGDGFGDIVIGAYRVDPGGRDDAGQSYVVFGKSSGFASSVDLASLDGTTGFRLDGIDFLDTAAFPLLRRGT